MLLCCEFWKKHINYVIYTFHPPPPPLPQAKHVLFVCAGDIIVEGATWRD